MACISQTYNIPAAPDVLIKYASDVSGTGESTTPSTTLKYISFSTDNGKTWSTYTKYIGEDGASGGGTNTYELITSVHGDYDCGTSVSSWVSLEDASSVLSGQIDANSIDTVGDIIRIEALYKVENITSELRKFRIDFGSLPLQEYQYTTQNTLQDAYIRYKAEIYVTSVTPISSGNINYASSIEITGQPTIKIEDNILTNTSIDFTSNITISPKIFCGGPSTTNTRVVCKNLIIEHLKR